MSTTIAETDDKKVLREVIGVFFEADSLEQAIVRLKSAGFGVDQIGLLAHSEAVSSKLGHLYDEVASDADTGESPEFRFVGKRNSKPAVNAFLGGLGIIATAAASGGIVASAAIIGGPIGAATAGAVVVGGIGALAGSVISESDSQRLQSYLEEGHLLLFVRVRNSDEESKALDIVKQFSGVDTEVVTFRPGPA